MDDAVVDATLPFLGRQVRGLVEFQRLTGCRPGEACGLRWYDVDTSGAVWTYKPPQHKNTYRGKSRTIQSAPLAQKVLAEFPTSDPEEYLFSPSLAVTEFRAARSAARKTPRSKTPPATRQAKKKPRGFGAKYNTDSYGLAIDRACDNAFPAPAPLAPREDETAAAWDARLTAEKRDQLLAWKSRTGGARTNSGTVTLLWCGRATGLKQRRFYSGTLT